jgi:hypothetical protein
VVHDGAGQGVEGNEVSQHPCSLPARKKYVPTNMDNLTNKIPYRVSVRAFFSLFSNRIQARILRSHHIKLFFKFLSQYWYFLRSYDTPGFSSYDTPGFSMSHLALSYHSLFYFTSYIRKIIISARMYFLLSASFCLFL